MNFRRVIIIRGVKEMSNRSIVLTEFDVKRLRKLLAEARYSDYRGSEYLEDLAKEIHRGKVLPPEEIPADVITMNSKVRLEDLESGEELIYTVVFPPDADHRQGKISVLAPVGTAILGFRVGDVIEWKVPEGVTRLKVKEVLYQPESSGDFDL
jgi:regulator of nucleoside diphosphate kinase